MTKTIFRTKATEGVFPNDIVAEAWMGPDNRLHIRMAIDNAFDVVFEDGPALRPRSVLLGTQVAWQSSEIR